MRFLLIATLICVNLFSSMDDYFKKVDALMNIDQRILKTIAKIESNYNPYAIGVLTSIAKAKRLLRFIIKNDIDHNIGFVRGNLVQISISPTSYNQALRVLGAVKTIGIKNYDIGIMQINRMNVSSFTEEKILLKSPLYNIAKGAKILRGCFATFKDQTYKVIECYNKGFSIRGRSDYFRKFLKTYKKIAGL